MMLVANPKQLAQDLVDAPHEEPVDVELLRQLLEHVRQAPPDTLEERDEWVTLVAALRTRVRRELTEVGRQLRHTSKARRGLQGYGSLKSVRHSQHADKVV